MNRAIFRLEVSPVEANKMIGPVRSHLYSFAIAQKMKLDGHSVSCIMKCDDSDPKKHEKKNFYDIYVFLSSLGIRPDIHPYNSKKVSGFSLFQSERAEIYRKHLEKLYDCGLAHNVDNSDLAVFNVEKFAANHGSQIEVTDELLGRLVFNIEDLLKRERRTIPLRRSDGSYLFNFVSVADDIELGVTHVVRGQDKIHVVPIQEMLRIALGSPPTVYIHLPLLCDEKGKRTGGYMRIDDFLRAGITREALISYLLSSGYGTPGKIEIFLSLDEFITKFHLRNLHRKNTAFCAGLLDSTNRRMTRLLSPDQYRQSLQMYAEKLSDPEMEKITKDTDIHCFLEEFRLPPKEAVNLADRIMFPKETPPDTVLIECIKQTIERLRLDAEFDVLASEMEHFSKDVFCRGLRWILMREVGGIELKKIFLLLKKKGLLIERAEKAERAMQQLFKS